MLTGSRLEQLLNDDQETGIFTWRGGHKKVRAGMIAGTPDKDGYICIKIDQIMYKAHRLAWLWMTGDWPTEEVDHKDLDKSNNRFGNLREATHSQNNINLATILDLYSRKIVGWAMCDHLRAGLPLAALRMAISAQRPRAGLIHHSDRGVQYASAEYRKAIQSAGFQASMSRKGDCYDNAPMESFFHTPKTELVYQTRYATRAEATRDIFAYVEGFYNRTRRHSAIGYISPIEMELRAA